MGDARGAATGGARQVWGPRRLAAGLVGTDQYLGLLLVLLGSLVLFATVRGTPFGGAIRVAAEALALALAVRAAGVPWRQTGLWVLLGVVAVFVSLIADAVVASHSLPLVSDLISLAFSVTMVVIIGRRLLRHLRVGFETVLGAVCVYLILGSLFAAGFAAIDAVKPGFFTDLHAASIDYLYFSFGQLTTVGSPPLVPGPAVARMLGDLEALMGQIYLVTVIALLVGNLGRSRLVRRRDAGGDS